MHKGMRLSRSLRYGASVYGLGLMVLMSFAHLSCGSANGDNESTTAQDSAAEQDLDSDLNLPYSELGTYKIAETGASFSRLESMRTYMEYVNSSKRLGSDYVGTLMISGGFSTCTPGPGNTQIYARTVKLLWERAAQGQYFRIVASCFSRSNKSVYYFTSSDSETVRRGVAVDFAAAVAWEASKTESHDVFGVGHSYGGWLVLNTARTVPNWVHVRGLATMDPISTLHCSPGVFINAYLNSMFSYKPNPDCTRAPRDITAFIGQSIRKRVEWWHNFYQINSGYVHSGALSGATNHYISYDYTGVFELANAHFQIDTDDRVWSVFADKVKK